VRGLAEALGGQASLHARPRVVVLRRGTSDEALFCVYGVALYQHVARSLPEHLTVYGVFIPTETEIFEQEKLQKGDFSFPGVAELARQYVSIMTEVQPEGPYRVMGISFGGLVAYEIARQLRALGQEVVFLGLLDALLPGSIQESGFRRWGRQLKTFVADVDGRQVVLRALRAKVGRVSSAPFSERQLTWLRDRVHDQQIAHYAKELPDYPGDAVIVRATDHSEYGTAVVDAGAGWRERIRGSVAEYDVPGRHLEIVEPPSSDILAKMLSAHLA
jgi:thioesterase domain-containing protein